MPREYFLRLAAGGHRTIIGTDLVLHSHSDAAAIALHPERLGAVVEESAARWKTPLAIPLMDLRIEKADILAALGLSEDQADRFHFEDTLPASLAFDHPFQPRQAAQIGAIRWVAARARFFACGMTIGPFSLATKLLADPVTAIALTARGIAPSEEPLVHAFERALVLAETAVARSVRAQIDAGARAVLVCEPAASVTFLSPRQLKSNPALFGRLVIEPNLRIRTLMRQAGVDLIFHDCGEPTSEMVRAFAHRLHPSVLSLGSSRRLWEDAVLVPRDTVLFGNLPTKTFYSDAAMPDAEVRRLTLELVSHMRACGHPHIPGSECDVLYVPDAAAAIWRKVSILLTAEDS